MKTTLLKYAKDADVDKLKEYFKSSFYLRGIFIKYIDEKYTACEAAILSDETYDSPNRAELISGKIAEMKAYKALREIISDG